jgi:hypothetical protein
MERRVDAIGKRIAALVGRLRDSGYAFDRPDEVFPGPAPGAPEAIQRLESTIGPLPLALKLFWLRVGSVDLTGSHPAWPEPSGYLDQLIVFPPEYALEHLADHLEHPEGADSEVIIAPDYFHKADVSGGSPYSVSIPAVSGDPPMNGTPTPQTFLEHLEDALRFGGFPGLADCPDHGWPIASLIDGLED